MELMKPVPVLWEYIVEKSSSGEDDLTRLLARRGKCMWELVTTHIDEAGYATLIFKRPV